MWEMESPSAWVMEWQSGWVKVLALGCLLALVCSWGAVPEWVQGRRRTRGGGR